MAKAKLTLSVDEAVVERAKSFSERHNTTVSRLVTDFLASLEDSEGRSTPIVSKLRGVIGPDVDRGEYREHLRRKHG